MSNITLGKVLKAMYKLSGKTLTQLSDESGLTLDTINNLFYARIQKPGLIGVNALVNAMGFSIQQLMKFLEEHQELAEDCDVTALFTKYISSAEDTDAAVPAAKENVKAAKGKVSPEIELLNEEHEKQLDRFRAANQRHMEQLQEQHDHQIAQMQAYENQMQRHFDKSVIALKEDHARELERMEKENARQRKTGRLLAIVVSIETGLILLLLILDMIDRNIGWLR